MKVRWGIYWEFDCNFFIPKSGCTHSHTRSYIFDMTHTAQDDHLIAGAWAACGWSYSVIISLYEGRIGIIKKLNHGTGQLLL